MLVASYGVNDDNSDYVQLRENLLARLDNSPELTTIIEDILQMHNDVNTAFKDFSTPRALFTHSHELNPTELVGEDTNPTKTPQDNGVTLPLLTHP